MPTKRRRYLGELPIPIIRPAAPTFEGAVTPARVEEFWRDYENHEREAERFIEQKLLQKMTLLCEHHGIGDQQDMSALALALAIAHVPGFKIVPETKTRKGRKRKWDGSQLLELLKAVEMVRSQHRLSKKKR
jgi:hypothetical protein